MVSAHFLNKKKLRAKISGVIIWSKFVFFWNAPNLDQILTSYLDQRITPQKNVVLLKCTKIPISTVFSEKINKNGQKCPKTDNFSDLTKHRLIKKLLCCIPPLDQKLVFFFCIFKENVDVEQKTKVKWGKNKDKARGFERKRRKETS